LCFGLLDLFAFLSPFSISSFVHFLLEDVVKKKKKKPIPLVSEPKRKEEEERKKEIQIEFERVK